MSDDFFSKVPLRRSSPENDARDDFAHALSIRFGSADLHTARLLPGDTHTPSPHPAPHPHSPQPLPPRPPSPQHHFDSVPPSALPPYLTDPASLILDIRPHAAHAAARINNALSLSVPTTLLKRPLFSLSKLSQMLPSPSSRARFADWPSASRILVYDSDSTFSPDNSIIAGLLRKFRAEGFTGELGWICGGFQAVWREFRDLATTEPPSPEEDDPDLATSSGTLRTTHLPRAAFSLFSTTAAPPLHFGAVPASVPVPNTPAPSASLAANPFFDTIRQNVELSHGITERIPLRLPRRVRRRINDLPSRWLQDVARRSALRLSPASHHPGLDSFESGSESSDDPHTSDPDENDPHVEEGTEALAMQFYRIELAEQRRLRSIMEHHTRESQVPGFADAANHRRRGSGVSVRTGAKSVPATPPITFPFSITAAVEKGTKNRYTHIWPFEHARVRLHDSRHHGSHPGRRDKDRASERGRCTKDRSGPKGWKREEQGNEQDERRRSRSSPATGKGQGREMTEVAGASPNRSFYFGARAAFGASPTHPTMGLGPGVPRVKIEYDTTEQEPRMSEPPTPATALPVMTPPFYTPMEMFPIPTPMRSWPPQLISPPFGASVSPGGRLGGKQVALSTPSLPYLGPLPSYPLRPPKSLESSSPSIGEQTWTSESLSLSTSPFGAFTGVEADGEGLNVMGTMRDLRREPSPVDDYVNASYVQPLCTRKRYIATQGPLPSTYIDFWTLVWEQNVHVIVMLTREVENAMVKCGSYWTDTEYGPLRLELLTTSPLMSPSANSTIVDISKQGFFAIREPQGKVSGASRDQPTLITRTFLLGHTSYPGVPPRRITHLQYLDWSDMNVPDDPQGVLDLVKMVEQAVAESTPGPSPSGSLSPGSGSSSLSGGQSPEVGPDPTGYDTSLLSPTSAGFVPHGGKRRYGSKWRHPELDSKSGIAAFALGRPAPVLLHCSAGVGRTGGFIAVDAVLDGIRRELRRKREERRLKKASRPGTVVSPVSKAGETNPEASGEFGIESAGIEIKHFESCAEENMADGSERMDVDELETGEAKNVGDLLHMVNTVPIHVSAGDRTKGRRRHNHGKDSSGAKLRSSSESFVVHVPYAGIDDVPEGPKASFDFCDAREADWQSSTREWVEKVSDQTHAHAEEGSFPPPLSSSTRERSPGSTSTSSGPSALNSTDGSLSGSANANAGTSADARCGVGNRMERKNDMGSASGRLPPSSVSKPGPGSVSLSTSGSGTGTGSQFGSSLLRVHLRDSSATSISAESMGSLPRQRQPKLGAPFHQRAVVRMEIDRPPRSVSVPLQPTSPTTASLQHGARLRRDKPNLGPLPVARFSSPILPGTMERGISFFGSDAADYPVSRSSSELGSDELGAPPQEFQSGESAGAQGSGKNGQRLSDDPEERAISSRPETDLRFNAELSTLKVPEGAENASLPFGQNGGEERVIPPAPRALDDSASRQFPTTNGVLGALEHDQRATDHPVIDYKLPRELHSDLSPPLISSFAEPICTIIQDMREQRMSLCQSLRQYVFVHAAVIEGALRLVDEERELWGYSGASDDSSSGEGDPRTSVGKSGRLAGHSEAKAWFGETGAAEVVATNPVFVQGGISPRTPPSHAMAQSSYPWSPEGNLRGGRISLPPASSSSGVPSPSKGKRAPSPTELLREDKSGALTLNKRPSIHPNRTSDEGDQFSLEANTSSPVSGENMGRLGDAVVGASGTQSTLELLAVPEKGGPNILRHEVTMG